MKKNEELEILILETVSFFEPMDIEKILIDMDSQKVLAFPELDYGMLQKKLKDMVKKGILVSQERDGKVFYQRNQLNQKNLFKRIKTLLFRREN